MRRITPLACALAILLLGACSSTRQATTAATQQMPTPTGNLCERLQSALPDHWKADTSEIGIGAPLADRCALVDPAQSSHRIRVQLSVLPVTPEQSAEFRRLDEALLKSYSTAKAVDGGIGTGSWAIDPGMTPPWLVFRLKDHQLRLTVENIGFGTVDELRSIAQTVAGLPGDLPSAPPVIARPECARGTAAAERVLGAKAVVRRDALIGGSLFCQWGSPARTVGVVSGDVSSGPALEFSFMKDASIDRTQPTHRVDVGAEGWQQSDGTLTFRTPKQTFVKVTSAPLVTMRPAPILALARAIAPAYR